MIGSLGAAAVMALASGAASAATVSIAETAAAWSSPAGIVGLQGQGTGHLSWGAVHPAGGNRQSGYIFEGAETDVSAEAEEIFALGTFTHENFAIRVGANSAITSATLGFDLSLDFDLGGGAVYRELIEFDWLFSHNETLNSQAPLCANGEANGSGVNVNGCADSVSFSAQGQVRTFEYAEGTITLEILGFQPGTSFWTVENQTNATTLSARFNYAAAPIPPIPLPSAAWLLLGALGGLALLRRRAAS